MTYLNRSRIASVLSDRNSLGIRVLCLFMMVYLISSGMDHKLFKIPLLCIGFFLLVFFIRNVKQPLLWFFFLTVLLVDLICDYFVRANHHFLLIYITAIVIIFIHNGRQNDLSMNIRWVLAIVLLFSGLQKMLSPQFVSGDFYYHSMNIGSFFKPLYYFNPEVNAIISSNKTEILELGKINPNESKAIVLQNVVPHLAQFSKAFAWFTIVFEMAVALLILWKPKHLATQLIFAILLFGIFLTRLENGFLTILAICGIFLSENLKVRFLFSLMAMGFMALIIAKIGFY